MNEIDGNTLISILECLIMLVICVNFIRYFYFNGDFNRSLFTDRQMVNIANDHYRLWDEYLIEEDENQNLTLTMRWDNVTINNEGVNRCNKKTLVYDSHMDESCIV